MKTKQIFSTRNELMKEKEEEGLKQAIAERMARRINAFRKERMNAINAKRINLMEESSSMEVEESDYQSEDASVLEYIEKIKELLSDEVTKNEFEISSLTDCHVSVCPFCQDPAISVGNIVTCINKCFSFKVSSSFFSEKYTMDNLMDLYMQAIRKHKECKSSIELLIMEDTIIPYCQRCYLKDPFSVFENSTINS